MIWLHHRKLLRAHLPNIVVISADICQIVLKSVFGSETDKLCFSWQLSSRHFSQKRLVLLFSTLTTLFCNEAAREAVPAVQPTPSLSKKVLARVWSNPQYSTRKFVQSRDVIVFWMIKHTWICYPEPVVGFVESFSKLCEPLLCCATKKNSWLRSSLLFVAKLTNVSVKSINIGPKYTF